MAISRNENEDVRMKGFRSRATVEQALAWLDAQVASRTATPARQTVSLDAAAARVLADDITSDVDVPHFARAMMDGFALHAEDTSGASTYNRLPLQERGVSLPGQPYEGTVHRGQAIRVMTGTPIPSGADAVLPVERTQREPAGTIYALGEVPPGKHIGVLGEDIQRGQIVLRAGRRLRPQDLGLLSSIGIRHVPVLPRPRVLIAVTGNELVPEGQPTTAYQIADANGPMLQACVSRDGGVAIRMGIVADTPDAIRDAMQQDVEVVLVTGGSSCGEEDHAPTVLATQGELAIHGIAMRPSSPAGMGTLGKRLVFLLPGNPVSCLCAYDFFAGRAIRSLAGHDAAWPYRSLRAPLAAKLVSQIGRVDYARVRLVDGRVEPLAIAGASILSSTTRADGFVVIQENSEGHPAGEVVEVWQYDP